MNVTSNTDSSLSSAIVRFVTFSVPSGFRKLTIDSRATRLFRNYIARTFSGFSVSLLWAFFGTLRFLIALASRIVAAKDFLKLQRLREYLVKGACSMASCPLNETARFEVRTFLGEGGLYEIRSPSCRVS